MSKQSFNVERSLRLKPIDPATLTTPKNGELICDSTDSNKLKKYNEGTSTWEQVTSATTFPGSSLFLYQARAATTGNITLSGVQTVDGVVLIAGDRVLVKNQTTSADNGIYVVGTPWTRATDMATWASTINYAALVSEGTIWSGMLFTSATTVGGTLNTTAINWDSKGSGNSTSADTALGYLALNSNTTGINNTAFGASTLTANTTGTSNTAVGSSALATNITANDNSAFGYRALLNATGASNTAVGSQALATNIGGNNNTSVGVQSLYLNTSGTHNIAIGNLALYTNTTASNNIGVGHGTLQTNQTGTRNVAIGHNALQANTNSDNTAIGHLAMLSTVGGFWNVAVGSISMQLNQSGTKNTAVGYQSLYANLIGESNTAIGSQALQAATGNFNTAIGAKAMYATVAGTHNVAVGVNALSTNISGISNTAIGWNALLAHTGSECTAIGQSALAANTANSNTAIGYQSLRLNTTGVANVAVGAYSLWSHLTGNSNVAVGQFSLQNDSTGTSNIAIGGSALYNNTSGSGNIGIGLNTGITYHLTDTDMIYIGQGSNKGVFTSNVLTNAITIGVNSRVYSSNSIVLGNSTTTAITTTGRVFNNTTISNITAATGQTLTGAQLAGGVIYRSGPTGPISDIVDTAINIAAAIPNAMVGVSYELTFTNTTTSAITLATNTGVTLVGTTDIAASTFRKYIVKITSLTRSVLLDATLGDITAASVTITGIATGGAASSSGAGGIQKIDVVDTALTSVPTGVSAVIDGVTLVDGMLVLFTALTVGANEVYSVSGVGASLVFTAQNIFTGIAVPTTGDMLYVKNGTGYKARTIFFDATAWQLLTENYKVVTAGAALSAGQLAYISVGNANGDTGNTLGSTYAYAPFTLYKSQPLGFVKYAVTTGQKALIQVSGVYTLASAMASTDYGRRAFALTSTTLSTANTSTQRSNAGLTVHPWGIYETSVGTMIDTTNISVNIQSTFIPSYVRSSTALVNIATDVDTIANLPNISSMTDGIYCVLEYTVIMTDILAAVKTQTGQIIAWKGDNVNWDYSHTFNIATDIGFRVSVTAAGVIQYIAPTATIGSITNFKIHSINNRG